MQRAEAQDLFRTLVTAVGEVPLDVAMALYAVDELGEGDVDAWLGELDRLAQGLYLPDGAALPEAVARLCQHLFVAHGFHGDEAAYDDPRNSLLGSVLARKQGLPILLSALLMEVGRRRGIALDGIGFPGHFLVRPRQATPAFYIDAFHRGRILRDDELLARFRKDSGLSPGPVAWAGLTAVSDARAMLVRMSQNLKGSHFRRGDLGGTLRSVERLCLLQPAEPDHRRDRGWLLIRVGRAAEGQADYEHYLRLRPRAEDAAEIRAELEGLKGS